MGSTYCMWLLSADRSFVFPPSHSHARGMVRVADAARQVKACIGFKVHGELVLWLLCAATGRHMLHAR
jgi:hypothetical protein